MYTYATLVTNPDYALGALALARSLAAVNSAAPLLVLATAAVPQTALAPLRAAGCEICLTQPPKLSDAFRARHSRAEQHRKSPFTKGTKPAFHDPLDNFCKLQLWQLVAYERVVFLDADTLVIKNIDRLFGYPEFSAAPNLYERLSDMHRLNSGVFVATPSNDTYTAMLCSLDPEDAADTSYWPRTDQSFLEAYFPAWHGLPYTFNALQYLYFNLPELWDWQSINVVHYQYEKPWQSDHGKRSQLQPLIDLWAEVLAGKGIPTDLPAPESKARGMLR
jgi:alpha-N-acetylglucosamine transferase